MSGTAVVDLDGVVWLTGHPLPGAVDGIARLRKAGLRVLFVTNNSAPSRAALLERFDAMDVDVPTADLLTSADALALLLVPGERVLLAGEAGLREAIEGSGCSVVDGDGPVDVVAVGWDRSFSFETLARLTTALRAGARFLATNEDPTHPSPEGLRPGTGALVAAVATAGGVEPTWAGKPHQPMVDLVARSAADIVLVIGDRSSTDGALARALRVPFGLVRSEVDRSGAGDYEGPDLESVVEAALNVQR